MIPKTIHYCWFGRGPKLALIERCIASWQKYCPDYEIIEWNEDNYDVNCIPFTRDAYADKKWAYVSDYARLDIIYNQGGYTSIPMFCCMHPWTNCCGMIAGLRPMMSGI